MDEDLKVKAQKIGEVLQKVSCGIINQLVIENEGLISVTDDTRSIFVCFKDENLLNFKQDLGIYDLKLFLSFLSAASGYEKLNSIDIKDNRLTLSCGTDEYQYLLADSKLISQRIKEPQKVKDKIDGLEKIVELDLLPKLSAITKALTLLTTDNGWFKVANGKLILEIGNSIEHRIRINLLDNVSGNYEWKFSTILLGKILNSATGSTSVMLELRKDCPMIFKYADLFVALNTITDKEKKG